MFIHLSREVKKMRHKKEWNRIIKKGSNLYYESKCLSIENAIGIDHDEIVEQLVADYFGLSGTDAE